MLVQSQSAKHSRLTVCRGFRLLLWACCGSGNDAGESERHGEDCDDRLHFGF